MPPQVDKSESEESEDRQTFSLESEAGMLMYTGWLGLWGMSAM
jgi:hypothetical protein